jgi:hypothetical protein
MFLSSYEEENKNRGGCCVVALTKSDNIELSDLSYFYRLVSNYSDNRLVIFIVYTPDVGVACVHGPTAKLFPDPAVAVNFTSTSAFRTPD